MPRSIWSGSITFGLLSIPVKLYAATSDNDVAFNTLHAGCGSRLGQQMICKVHGTPVDTMDRQRAYEVSKDTYVAITDADLAGLPVPSRKVIEVDAFVDPGEVDPVYCERAYYLEPDGAPGAKPYALLAQALTRQDMLGVAKITLRNHERLCTLRPFDGVLVLETLYWPDEVRDLASGRDLARVQISDAELDLACQLVDSRRETFDGSKYTDTYRTALLDLIERKKADPNAKPEGEASAPAPQAVELLAVLKAELERVKSSKTEAA